METLEQYRQRVSERRWRIVYGVLYPDYNADDPDHDYCTVCGDPAERK